MMIKKYKKEDVLKCRCEGGYILTYCIMDITRGELKDYVVIETNTLKEINQWLKNQ